MNRVIGVIQARMGSRRIPRKAMIDLAGRPLIWHLIDRVRRVKGVGHIIVATTADPLNEPMIKFARSEGLGVFQHPDEDDLAGRIAGAIRGVKGDLVLKVGGDCPLIDPVVLQRMVDRALAEVDADFVSNRVRWSYPMGLSADVLSRRAIEWCDANLSDPEKREFFALYIRDHPERFKVIPIVHEVDLSHYTWTLDEPQDVAFMKRVFNDLYEEGDVFGLKEMLAYLEAGGEAFHG